MNEQSARPVTPARVATIGALVAAVVIVTVLLLGSGGGYTYQLRFTTGGQLVNGNQVVVGGQPIGSIEEITLTDNAQAEVTISVDRQLHEGTTAVIRSTSLSGIANRYISLTLGADNAPKLGSGQVITAEKTTSPVDLDQLFNTFTPRVRTALGQVIQGFAGIYAGKGSEANAAYRYLSPALFSTQRLLAELNGDQRVFSQFLINSSRVVTALASRRHDLSSLVSNANTALGAVAQQNQALDRSLVALPPTLREANTTFVNLRATLDDLDPLVADAKPATKDLAPFLRQLRPVAERGVPVFHDLRLTLHRNGSANDLNDILRQLPLLQDRASTAFPRAIDALNDSLPVISFARPYSPDLLGFVTKFGQGTAFYDANGHYARVQSAGLNLFRYDVPTQELRPIPKSQQFNGLQFNVNKRCPGAASQPAVDGSSPFLDQGKLTAADCDPTQVPPGP